MNVKRESLRITLYVFYKSIECEETNGTYIS
jgi:hypothetical protein